MDFTGERIIPEAKDCEPTFAKKMYQEHIGRYFFASQFSGGKTVLDLACGVGYGSKYLALNGAKTVDALDISREAIQHARQNYSAKNLKFHVWDIQKKLLFERPFDVITCFEAIEHVKHQRSVIKNMKAHLSSHGIGILSTPRPLGEIRSEFHEKELEHYAFNHLLANYFAHIEYFVQNNHFSSLITFGTPSEPYQTLFMNDQWNLDQADYFVAVVSQKQIDLSTILSTIVINDDSYVLNCEKDIHILRDDVARSEEYIRAKDTRLTAIEEQLKQEKDINGLLKQYVANKDEQINQLEQNSEEKTTIIKELERVIADRDAKIKSHENKNAEQSRQIQSLKETIDQRDAVIKSEHEKSSQQSRNIRSLKETIDQWDAVIKSHENKNTEQSREIQSLKETIDQRDAVIKSEHEKSSQQFQKIQSLKREVLERDKWQEDLTKETNTLRQELRIEKHNLELVLLSKSWWITAPLRKSLDLLHWIRTRSRHLIITSEIPPSTKPPVKLSSSEPSLKLSWEEDGCEAVVLEPDSHLDVLYVIGCLEGESKRYRVYNQVKVLRNAGYKVAATVEIDLEYIADSAIIADNIVFFRLAWSPAVSSFMDYAEKAGAKTYFDIDDLVFEPESIAYVRAIEGYTKLQRANYCHDVQRYKLTLENSDSIITTTDFLASRVLSLGKECLVVPNTVCAKQIELAEQILQEIPSKMTNVIRIGYFSGTATHDCDFLECEEALVEIMSRHPQCTLVLVGYLSLSPSWDTFKKRIERHDFMPYLDMLHILATVDINLAPLEIGNPYCEGKSQLKIFEAGLLNVPTVAAATSSYRTAITRGRDGFLAASKEEWISALDELISSPEKRKALGAKAHSRALSQFGPDALTKELCNAFNLNSSLVESSGCDIKGSNSQDDRFAYMPKNKKSTVGWFIPPLIKGGGGHRTIFQNINALVSAGYECHAYIEPGNLQNEKGLFVAVEEDFDCSGVKVHSGFNVERPLDLLFATASSTAKQVKDCSIAAKKVYFIQDYEALFYPMGDNYILSENTYKFGLSAVTIGRWLTRKLKTDFMANSWFFDFCADLEVYRPITNVHREKAVCFIYQPEKPRRCAQVGLESLSIMKRLRPNVKIYLYGSRDMLHNVSFEHENLKLLSIEECNSLYNRCSVGLCISSSNPSRIPFEMMASGLPVVDIYRENNIYDMPDQGIVLAEQSPESIAKAIIEILDDDKKQESMSEFGIKFMSKRPLEKGYQQFVEAVTQVLDADRSTEEDLKPMYKSKPVVAARRDVIRDIEVTPKTIRAGIQHTMSSFKDISRKMIFR